MFTHTVVLPKGPTRGFKSLEESLVFADRKIATMGRSYRLGMVKVFDHQGNRSR